MHTLHVHTVRTYILLLQPWHNIVHKLCMAASQQQPGIHIPINVCNTMYVPVTIHCFYISIRDIS